MNVLGNVLASPRRRKRLAILTTFVVVAVPLVFLAAHYTTSGSPGNANGPYVSDSFYREPKHVPFTAEKRRAVSAVLAKFIDGAVSKHDLAGTWDLAGPGLRQGLKRQDWLKGQLPLVPFAASKRGQGSWSLVNYSYKNKVGLELLMFPEHRSGQLATVETDVVRGRDGHWRVDYWMITKLHGPGSAAAADSASAMSEGPPNVHKLPGKEKKKAQAAAARREAADPEPLDPTGGVTHLDAKWLLVPVGLLSLTLLTLIGLGVAAWIRNRRAAAAYSRAR
jgi:hypothetical protein